MAVPTGPRQQVLADLARLARGRAATLRRPCRVAVDGPDAAGKSTLAGDLVDVLRREGPAVVVEADDFQHPAARRRARGGLDPVGYYTDAFDVEVLVRDVLVPLGPGGSRSYRPRHFDLAHDVALPEEWSTAPPDAVVVVAGVFLHRPELRPHWDLSVYLHVTPEETLRRAVLRDRAAIGSPETVSRRYANRYLPAQATYRDEVDPLGACDVALDPTDPGTPVVLRTPD